MADCTSTHRGRQCQRQAPHTTELHKHETDDGTVGTWVRLWSTPDLDTRPEYPDGFYILTPAVAKKEDFTG